MSSPRAELDELAEVHHADPVGQVLDDREVVGDHDRGRVVLDLETLHQVQDLRADRDVERADRLVGDDHLRLEHQRARQRDPLPLSAGELVRVALERVVRQPDLVAVVGDPRVLLLARADALDRPAARAGWREPASAGRATRTDPGTSSAGRGGRGAAPRPRSENTALARQQDPASVGFLDADHQLAERRLAAAGLADEAERFAGVDVQRSRRRRP